MRGRGRGTARRPSSGNFRALVCALWVASCTPVPAPRPTSASSSIVLSHDESRLFVASPDDDAVVVLSAADGSELSRIAITGGPEQLAWVDDAIVVTLGRLGSVALVTALGLRGTIEVPCGSTRGVATLRGRTFVSCPDDGRILELNVVTGETTAVLELEGGPSALASWGTTLGVTLERRGTLVELDLSGGVALGLAPRRDIALESAAGHAASQASVLAVDPVGGFVALFQRVEHDGDRDRDPARGGYGSIVDGAPRIEPRLRSACGDRYARFDGGARAMSGPAAAATAGGHLWVANMYTDNVLLAHCEPESDAPVAGELDTWTTFGVGRAPRGIALSADGHTAFVDAGFDWAVSRLDAPDAARPLTPVTWTRRRTLGTTALSEEALRGRSLFFDAVDTHLTPSGVVTCGTCHPRGGDDGLSWFLHTTNVPRKVRRTPAAWGARPWNAPFHWDGEPTDVAVLARSTTAELMEGDGLLVDFPAIAAYLAEVPSPSPRPVASATEATERSLGARAFITAGCTDCHVDGPGTDGMSHAVLPPSADPDAVLAMADTPSLVGVRARPPYFHDGRAPTLLDTITIPGDLHGRTSSLTDDERRQLVAYLESL